MSTLIVIPARGGSKGIARKNMQAVGERSLVARAMLTAIHADVGTVWVSTDDAEIAAEADAYGVYAHPRPAELASDEATTESVLIDCVRAMPELPAYTILMQCTSPFTHARDIQHVADRLVRGAECVITVTPFYEFLWDLDRNGVSVKPLSGIGGCIPRQRRQDRDPPWLETGQLYGMRTSLLLEMGSRFCGKVEAVMVPKYRAPEIDDAWDLEMCQRMAGWSERQAPGQRP